MVGQVKNVYKHGGGLFRLCRKSWSYRRQRRHGHLILSDVRNQGEKATCLLNAICGIMEAKLSMNGTIVKLSVDHLEKLANNLISSSSGQRSLSSVVSSILLFLTHVGIYTEEDYNKGCVTGPRYKITSVETLSWFRSTTPGAIHKLREKGPLLAVIKISENFQSDFLSGGVYRFDKTKPKIHNGQTRTHAVISTGYAIDNLLPVWEMQNSHGKIGEERGFGYFDFDSLVGLYSINMDC